MPKDIHYEAFMRRPMQKIGGCLFEAYFQELCTHMIPKPATRTHTAHVVFTMNVIVICSFALALSSCILA